MTQSYTPLIDPTELTVEQQLEQMNMTTNPDDQIKVVTLNIGGQEWNVPLEEWEKAQEESRTYPVTFQNELRLVDKSTFEEFKKLSEYLNGTNKRN